MGNTRTYRLIHAPSGIAVAQNVKRADNLIQEGVGLLGRREMETEEGLWLANTPFVHTLGMRVPIDVLFLNRVGRAVLAVERLAPGRLLCGSWRAASCVELPAGALMRAGSIHEGDTWLLEQAA